MNVDKVKPIIKAVINIVPSGSNAKLRYYTFLAI